LKKRKPTLICSQIVSASVNGKKVQMMMDEDSMHIRHNQFMSACRNGDVGEVERLVDTMNVDPSVYSNCGLAYAAQQGHAAVVKRLLKYPSVSPLVEREEPDTIFRIAVTNLAKKPILNWPDYAWGTEKERWETIDILYADTRLYSCPTLSVELFHVAMFRTRMSQVCFALQELDLPALLVLKIIDRLIPNTVRMWAKWQIIVTIKHFRRDIL
jgi:hypothetical protein